MKENQVDSFGFILNGFFFVMKFFVMFLGLVYSFLYYIFKVFYIVFNQNISLSVFKDYRFYINVRILKMVVEFYLFEYFLYLVYISCLINVYEIYE